MTEFNPLEYGAKPRQANTQSFDPTAYGAKPRATEKPEDSWMELLGKSALKGISSLADIPKSAAQGLESIKNAGSKMYGAPVGMYGMGLKGTNNTDEWAKPNIRLDDSIEDTNYASSIPDTNDARAALKQHYDIDLEPHPNGAGQRMVGHGVEFATSVSPFAKGKKVMDGVKLMGTAGAAGTASGVAQELGFDPLASDIVASVAAPTAASAGSSIKNYGKGFTQAARKGRVEDDAKKILQNTVGEKNIPEVLKRLDEKTPLNANLNTAEMANNSGLSRLHQTTSPNISAIAEKEAVNDSLIRNKLTTLSSKTGLTPESAGKQVRDHLTNNLDSHKLHRTEVTTPLYASVEGLTQGVPLPNTNAYLKSEVKYAKGEIKNNLDYVQSIIKPNAGTGNSIPAELNNAVKDISGKIGAAKRAGNDEVVRVLQKAKENILKDMSHLPEEALARSTYSQLSKPVSAIENEPLLSQFIKKNQYGENYLMSSEKIPDKILTGSMDNIKSLMAQAGSKGKTVETIRGLFVDKLLNISKTNGVNAHAKDGISYHKFNAFMNKNKAKLDLIFTQEQVKVLNEAKSILRKRNMANTLGKSAGSNTQSDTTLMSELFNPVKNDVIKTTFERVPLVGGVIRGKKRFNEIHNEQVKSLIAEAVVNPDKAKLLLSPSNIIKDSKDMDKLLLAFPILANNRSEEQKQKKSKKTTKTQESEQSPTFANNPWDK